MNDKMQHKIPIKRRLPVMNHKWPKKKVNIEEYDDVDIKDQEEYYWRGCDKLYQTLDIFRLIDLILKMEASISFIISQ